MAYSIFMDGRKLPVSTDKVVIKSEVKSREYDIIGVGKVQTPESRDLHTVEFKTEFPSRLYGYVNPESWEPPERILKRLKALQESGRGFRFVAVGDDKFTLEVTLESLSSEENATEDGDYTVTIRLKEYRDFGAVLTEVERLPRPGTVPISNTIVVRPGQTIQEAGGGSLRDKKRSALSSVPTNVMGGYAMYQATGVGGALEQVLNPIMAKENKPIYLSAGQVEFSVSKTTQTIAPGKWGTSVGKGLNDFGEALNNIANDVGESIRKAMENVPK